MLVGFLQIYIKKRKGSRENIPGIKDGSGWIITDPTEKSNCGRAERECDGTRKRTGGEVKGKRRMEGVASSRALYRTRSIQHYYR